MKYISNYKPADKSRKDDIDNKIIRDTRYESIFL